MHQQHPTRYPFLLESAARNPRIGRFDVLMAFPQEDLSGASALSALSDVSTSSTVIPKQFQHLPFLGGWFVFLPYEFAQEVEPSLRGKVPLADLAPRMVRCPAAIVRDHVEECIWLVSERGQEDIQHLDHDLRQSLDVAMPGSDPSQTTNRLNEAPGQTYCDQVERILDYIRAGDVFQVNLSRAWSAELPQKQSPAELYRHLRSANPAPFSALAVFEDLSILSSSPERLVEVRDGWIQTRPIAGTRPRSADQAADERLAQELLAHRKEQAEHVMLIDLERNDLGRVAVPGTVEVDEHMVLESYAHVHHIVSNVRAQLREGLSALDVIHAVFPGGTITGCPKVRCMEIIGELEQEPRGVYTGSLGYLDCRGHLDLNILIRTLELRGNELRFRTGAGIVADSTPEAELAETRAKAKGLLRALGIENPDNGSL
ncbi:MAG: aminodeoxychorismate synthase component I [Gammaproteobacteria bacterium]